MANVENGNDLFFSFFSQPDECRQFGLEVENRVFWIPKDGLCAYSPVFKNMLYGDFRESKRDTVKLPGKKAADLNELLYCLFPTPIVKKIDDTNVDVLLDFADEYEIVDLTSRCCDFLQHKLDQLRNGDEKLLDVLVLASKHRLHRILFRVAARCAECFELEKFELIFDRLSSEVLGALAWYKCQRSAAKSEIQFSCNNCRRSDTQNRCTRCGGSQRCPLCNALPRKSRHCVCHASVGNLSRGSSYAALAEHSDNEKYDNSDKNSKSFDGAVLLLKRL